MIRKTPGLSVEPLPIPPAIEEILKQQRMILEILQELVKHMAHPTWVCKEKEE